MNDKDKLEEALLKIIMENTNDNKTKYISERGDEVKEFFNTIDFKPLFDKIKEYIGDNSIDFTTPELEDFKYSGYSVIFNSTNNLKDKCGIMSCVYDEIVILANAIISQEDAGNNELYLWVPVHYKFQYISGGSNGCEIFNAVYKKSNGWEFSI